MTQKYKKDIAYPLNPYRLNLADEFGGSSCKTGEL